MHRCHIAPPAWSALPLVPDDEEAHHLLHVLRARQGDEVIAFDGLGRRATCRVRLQGGDVSLEPIPGTEQRRTWSLSVTLYQSVLKGPRMDLLVEKATELGAGTIVPVMTDRSIVRLTPEQSVERRQRWQRIAIGAAKQCGTDWVPAVAPVVRVADLAPRLRAGGLCLLGSLAPAVRPVADVLAEARAAGVSAVSWIIGPEGDLTDAEHAACLAAGALPVTLGLRVLRAETAALHALSITLFALGDHLVAPGS